MRRAITTNLGPHRSWSWPIRVGVATGALALVVVLGRIAIMTPLVEAHADTTFTLLYSFKNRPDGSGTRPATSTALPITAAVRIIAIKAAGQYLSWIRRARKPCCTASPERRTGIGPWHAWSGTRAATCTAPPIRVALPNGERYL